MATNPILLDKLSSHVRGAIWVGTKALSTSTPGFSEMNYIFDGLLSQSIHLKNDSNIFFTKNFGEDFFVQYFIDKIEGQLFVPKLGSEQRKTLLILNSKPESAVDLEALQSNYPGYILELLPLKE